METIVKKNMDDTMFEEEKTMDDMDDMDDLPVLRLTPSSYIHNDGTHFWKYWCNECGEKLSSCFSRCKCVKVEEMEKVKNVGDILFSISIDEFDFKIEDPAPTSAPKLEIGISSYTKDGVTEWRYPCGVCHRGLPNATSFCCCSICGNRTPGYWSPCITCTK
jgi:hypothetical protein